MVTKTKFPGICNACGRKCEYQIRCGIHTIMLCGSCLKQLGTEIQHIAVTEAANEVFDNSRETGLIKDNDRVPPTGGIV